MLNLSPLDVTLLVGMGILFLAGLGLGLLWLRHVIAQMEDATAALEILHEHPDLLQGTNWESWTGSVDMPPIHPAAAPRSIGHV